MEISRSTREHGYPNQRIGSKVTKAGVCQRLLPDEPCGIRSIIASIIPSCFLGFSHAQSRDMTRKPQNYTGPGSPHRPKLLEI